MSEQETKKKYINVVFSEIVFDCSGNNSGSVQVNFRIKKKKKEKT